MSVVECVRQSLPQLVIIRAIKYFQINFIPELADTTKLKVLCSGCRSRLANLETGKLTTERWKYDRAKTEIRPSFEDQQCSTRGTISCQWKTAAMFVRLIYPHSIIS